MYGRGNLRGRSVLFLWWMEQVYDLFISASFFSFFLFIYFLEGKLHSGDIVAYLIILYKSDNNVILLGSTVLPFREEMVSEKPLLYDFLENFKNVFDERQAGIIPLYTTYDHAINMESGK